MTHPESIGDFARAACMMEVLAPKPGNVYPGADWNFPDLKVHHFLRSANAIRSAFASTSNMSVGQLVLASVKATRSVVNTNTNLGQILLLSPLGKALASFGTISRKSVSHVLNESTIQDSVDTFAAIRLANPGGMGQKNDHDISTTPTMPLTQIMAMASAHDSIASEYATGYEILFTTSLPTLTRSLGQGTTDWPAAIVKTYLQLLTHGDTLVQRKCGPDINNELARRARAVLSHPCGTLAYQKSINELEIWLRADGHRRNPGTTADLVTAALFVAICQNKLAIPADLESLAAQHVQN